MRKLIEQCKDHDYVYLKRETVTIPEPQLKLIQKEIYACVYCGAGLDIYNLDEPLEIRNEV